MMRSVNTKVGVILKFRFGEMYMSGKTKPIPKPGFCIERILFNPCVT